MTREKAIRHFERYVNDDCYTIEHLEYCRMAIDALREQEERENPKPLTLEELRNTIGEPVYIVDLCKHGGMLNGWFVFVIVNEIGFATRGNYGLFSIRGYGKRWIAYRNKPMEETQ